MPEQDVQQPLGTDGLAELEAMGRVLRSRTFANAPVLRRFLQHAVELTLAHREPELKEYALGVDVFDRGASFDPRSDTIVRVQARRLRSKLRDYYETEGRADPLRIALPVGGYSVIFEPGDSPAPPPLRVVGQAAVERHPGSIPSPRTTLVGRAQEMARLTQLLQRDDARLVTLTGPGGSGKTRLAVEACGALRDDFPGGTLFVPLAPISAAESVLPTIAHQLSVRQSGGKTLVAALADFLRHAIVRPTLLFLDNFEHVLPAAPAIGTLLESCADLKVLITSRAVLHVSGEHEFPVPPLALPTESALSSLEALRSSPAIALFAERAAAVQPDFEVDGTNAASVTRICARLDGLPLAIELAAARVKMFSPAAIEQRLDHSLDFLAHGPLDAPARQQTLRSTIDWSHQLLGEAEQVLFRRLAVFRGGWSFESAEAVANPLQDLGVSIEEGLTSLLDKSLIVQTKRVPEPRFMLLDTLREYALERLAESGELDTTMKALSAYCIVMAEEGNRQLNDRDRETWLDACDGEHDNIRVALQWLVEHENADWAYRLVIALYAFWERREHLTEGRFWTEAVLAMPTAAAPTWQRAKALAYLGSFATHQGDYDTVPAVNQAAIDIFRELGDRKGIVSLLNSLGVVPRLQENWPEAQRFFEEGLRAVQEAGDRVSLPAVQSNLAHVLSAQGDHAAAATLAEEARKGFSEIGDLRGVAWSLNHLGDFARAGGDREEALRKYREALAAFSAVGDNWGTARTAEDLGELACDREEYDEALGHFETALDLFLAVGHQRGLARILEALAAVFARQADPEAVVLMSAAAAALRDRIGAAPRQRDRARIAQALGVAEPESSRDWEEARRQGASMSVVDVIAYAHKRCRRNSTPPASGTAV